MEKFRKLINIFVLFFIAVVLLPINAFADEGITLYVNKNNLTIGDELIITVSAPEDFETYALIAALKYDENVFQRIDDTSFTISDTESIAYNEENGKFGIINKTGKISGDLFSVHLKVKENASVGDTNIALTNISSSDGDESQRFPAVSTKVLVTRDAKEGESVPSNSENVIIEDEEKDIKTFTTVPIIIAMSVVAVIVLGLIIYMIVDRKNSFKKVPFIGLIVLELLLILSGSVLLIHNNDKKDINNDGVKDYQDAEEIIRYLIDIESEENKDKEENNKGNNESNQKPSSNGHYTSDYDTNNDGKVDINDAGHVTENTTEHTKVSLKEYKASASNYAQKGQVTLSFTADINTPGVKITKVKIESTYYDAVLNNGIYSVNIDWDKAGVQTFVIEEVVFDNGKSVKTNLNITKEILKDIPFINRFNLDDEKKSLSFEVVDDDKAFIDGTVNIYEGESVIASAKINANKVTINFDGVEGKTYSAQIIANYDLDSNLSDGINLYENTTLFDQTFTFGGDYNFILDDVSITDALKPGEVPVVSFTSTNTRNAVVSNANLTVSGKTNNYNITQIDGNNYEIRLSDADVTPGKHIVTLNEVGLSSLKTFYNDTDYKAKKLTYTVLKEAPSVNNLTVNNDKDSKNINVSFEYQDKNSATKKLTVVIIDSTGKIVDSKEITKDELAKATINTALSYEKSVDGFYTVRVLADYDLSDKYTYTNECLKEEGILTQTDIYIQKIYVTNNNNADTNNLYPVKNQKDYQIALDIYVGNSIDEYAKQSYKSSYSQVSSITINGLNYSASAISHDGNIYKAKIYLTVPNESGILDIKANRVQLTVNGYYKMYSTNYFSVEEKTVTIDVLKDKPKIDNLIINDDYNEGKATFNFDLVLDSNAQKDEFQDGKITIGDISKDISVGHNEIEFDSLPKDENLEVKFTGSYDLDTDRLNNITGEKNEKVNDELLKVQYGLYSNNTYDSIAINDGKAISKNNNNYFEKNEEIKLNFAVTGLDEKLNADVSKVIISDTEYSITKKDNIYELVLDGYHSSGEKEITITGLILTNGKKITLKDAYTIKPEVLKDVIKVSDYKFEDLDNQIKVTFAIKDPDSSIVGKPKVKITDENDNNIYFGKYEDTITFNKTEGCLRYYVKVISTYDRDIDKTVFSNNYEKEAILLEELISFEDNTIEFKNISDINLYKVEKIDGEDKVTLQDEVEVTDIENNKANYFVEIAMDNLPTTRARITNVSTENGMLVLELDYAYAAKDKTQKLRITFGKIEDGKAINEFHPANAFSVLLKKLEAGESVVLDRNYDASSITTEGNTYVTSEYSGTLDGNGHTIKNLSKPLFDKIKDGEVKNLYIVDVTLEDSGRGALANQTINAKVSNVLVDKVIKNQKENVGGNGGLIGTANNTTIDSSRVIHVSFNLFWLAQQNGTFVGLSQNNTKITNCYAEGTINSGYNFTSGFVGNAQATTMINNYVKVSFNGLYATPAAFASKYGGSESTYKNNVAVVTGGVNAFVLGGKEVENNYIYTTSEISDKTGVTKISQDEVNYELFSEKAKFSDETWQLKDITFDNLPSFVVENKTELEGVNNYNKDREIAYKNVMKLTPFYDNDKVIESGNALTDSNLINHEIAHIVPVDAEGKLVTYLTTDNPKKISKLKIIFKNGLKAEYKVLYEKNYDMVASYKISGLNIDYSFNHYVINSDSAVVNNLTNYLKNLNYTNNLDILTTNEDSRIYRDFYNETTRFELKEFVLKYLANSNYTNTKDDDAINDYIEREVKKDKKIEKALYTYNYFRRFYDLDVDGIKLYDLVMFDMQGFDENLTTDKITDLFFSDPSGANFNTNITNNTYNKLFSSYTELNNVSSFLDFVVTKLSDHNMDEWAASQFKGILREIPIEGHENDIQYTLWDHLSTEDANYRGGSYKVHNFVLPILTLPDTAAYIISAPAQFTIGSQRTYMANPKDEAELAKFNTKMQAYVDRIQSYYNTAYDLLQNPKLFNDIHLFQLDKRYTKNENGVSVYNTPYTTTELFHKNFDEVVALWPATYGVNAGNWGDRIEWNVAGFMDTDITTDGTVDSGHPTFMTWSHETAHYLDSRLFLENYGRRFDAGGEDYADAFLMQEFGINGIVMNLTVNYNKDTKVASNLTPERINSPEKIQDFYSKMFDTIYIMDYIEAQAFLQLPKEYQKALAVQVSYPNENKQFAREGGKSDGALTGATYKEDENARFRARETTGYTSLKDLADIELKTINDLVENQIMLYPGVYKYASRGNNSYGGEGINVVHWYQPNNPDGRPDSYALKWISYEMLSIAGYDKGFVGYASNKDYEIRSIYRNLTNPAEGTQNVNFKSDQMALQKITDNKYSDFNTYKKDRFQFVEDNLSHLNSEINVRYYVQEFYDALIEDKNYAESRLNSLFQNRTETQCLNDYWCSRDVQAAVGLPNSTAVRQEIYYKLKNMSNDFVEDIIYMDDVQQDVSNLTISKSSEE